MRKNSQKKRRKLLGTGAKFRKRKEIVIEERGEEQQKEKKEKKGEEKDSKKSEKKSLSKFNSPKKSVKDILANVYKADDLTVEFAEEAWQRIQYWVDICPVEISGLGCVRQQENGSFFVYEVFLLKQTNTASFTDIDDNAAAELMVQLSEMDEKDQGSRLQDLRFWWHSHVHMSVSWSPQDDYNIATKLFGEDQDPYDKVIASWFLSSVFNKKGEVNSRLDTARPWMAMRKLPYRIKRSVPEYIKKSCDKEYKEKVTDQEDLSWDWYSSSDDNLLPLCPPRKKPTYDYGKTTTSGKSTNSSVLLRGPHGNNTYRFYAADAAVKLYQKEIQQATEVARNIKQNLLKEKITKRQAEPIGYLFGCRATHKNSDRLTASLTGHIVSAYSSSYHSSFVVFLNTKDDEATIVGFSQLNVSGRHGAPAPALSSSKGKFLEILLTPTVKSMDLESLLSRELPGIIFSTEPCNSSKIITTTNARFPLKLSRYIKSSSGANEKKKDNTYKLTTERLQALYKEIEEEAVEGAPLSDELDWLLEARSKQVKESLAPMGSSKPTSSKEVLSFFEVLAFDIEELMEEYPKAGESFLTQRDYYKLAMLVVEAFSLQAPDEEEEEFLQEKSTEGDFYAEVTDYCESLGQSTVLHRISNWIRQGGILQDLSRMDLLELSEEIQDNLEEDNGLAGLPVKASKLEICSYIKDCADYDPVEVFATIVSSAPDLSVCTSCYELINNKQTICPNCKKSFDEDTEDLQEEISLLC